MKDQGGLSPAYLDEIANQPTAEQVQAEANANNLQLNALKYINPSQEDLALLGRVVLDFVNKSDRREYYATTAYIKVVKS